MKKQIPALCLAVLLITGLGASACSSNNDNDSPSQSQGQVPENTDSGNNNNPEPDNINPGTENPGGGDNTGGGNGADNTGGGDNTGDSGQTTPSWTLVFEDNFDSDGSTPNTAYWSLAPKGTDTWNRYMSESYDQAYQKDGYLYLFGMLKDGQYLTGGIETRKKFSFTYGQVKCRARFLRQPKGNHTGIWMMPEVQEHKWPMGGEIDIMEHINDGSLVYETIHTYWGDDLGHQDDPKDSTSTTVDNNDFNTYGIIWDETGITFTVNGSAVLTYPNQQLSGENGAYQWPFTDDFYIILSQSLGGADTWEGPIDNSQLPAIFQIDWIKVWQKN